jgi:predicted Zn-ribbon and HTH transcriptional regulator
MTETTVETFRCMMCGHEYQERVEKGEDKERSCPKCRSNSIRHLKRKAAAASAAAVGEAGG